MDIRSLQVGMSAIFTKQKVAFIYYQQDETLRIIFQNAAPYGHVSCFFI